MDKLKTKDFIDILGCEAIDRKVQTILKKLNVVTPVLNGDRDTFGDEKDTFWYEMEKEGFDLAFTDESIINKDKYADIGDGELIFMMLSINKFDNIELPFKITETDSYQNILAKIGKNEDRKHDLLSRVTWIFHREDSLEYTLSFTFDKTYTRIKKFSIVYSYGQLPWVEELRNNG